MKREIWKPDPWLPAITGTALIAIVIEIILLQEGVTQVYPHLFYIPIILAGYRFQRAGILIGCGLAAAYLLLHIIIFPDTIALAEAFLRFLVMAGVGIISGTFSWKLTESKKRYQTLFDDALNPVLIADEDGHYLDANKAALDFLNRSRDEVIGKSVWDFVPPECLEQEREAQNPFTSQRTRETPFLVDGEVKTLLLNVVPVRAGGKTTLYGIGLDITRSKQAEEELLLKNKELLDRLDELTAAHQALDETNEYLENLIAHANAPIIVWDQQCRITRFNDAFGKLTGIRPDDAIGSRLDILFPHNSRNASMDLIRRAMAGEMWDVVEIPIQHRSGAVRTVLWNSANIRRSGGEMIIATIAQGQDITEQKAIEDDLMVSEEKYRALVEHSLEGILILDMQGTILFANHAAAQLSELEHSSKLIGRKVQEFIAPESQMAVVSDFNEVAHGHDAFPATYNAIAASGRAYVIESIGKVISYDGSPAILLSIRDRTREKQATTALRESEEKFRALVEHSLDGILIADFSGDILYLNRSAARIVGVTDPKDLVGKRSVMDFVAPDSREDVIRDLQNVTRGIDSYLVNYHLITDADMSIWVESIGRRITFDGKPAILVSIHDITERKAAERTQICLASIVKSSYDAIISLDLDTRVITWNRGAEEILGWKAGEIIGRQYSLVIPLEDQPIFEDYFNEMIATKTPQVREVNRLHRSGRKLRMSATTSPILDQNGTIIAISGILRDITREKEMMQKIQENLYEKETLLREIHHRVKNNMQVVSSLLHLQALTIGDERFMGAFQDSENRIASMALVHEHLYQSGNLARINAAEYVRKLSLEIAHSYSSSGKITMTHRLDDLTLDIDTATYCGLIVNELLSNALKHAFNGREEGRIGISLEKDEEGSIILTFEDDGIGMPETIDPQTGSTLGVELIRTFVRQIKGSYSCSPRPGGGTRWQIWFRNEDDTGPEGQKSLTEDDTNPPPPSSA